MLKVILLEPEVDLEFKSRVPTYHGKPSLWALYLGTYLKKKISDFNITILDCRFFPTKRLIDRAKKIKPDFVGISPKYISYKNTIAAARIFKKSGAKVVLGGFYATALKKEILENRGPGFEDYCIDAIIKEDGEKAFYEYVSGVPPAKINNLIWRDGKEIRENRTELLNLDSLPIPDRELVDIDKYFIPKRKTLTFLSQKGCSWRANGGGCVFCSYPPNRVRLRNPLRVWEEIMFLKKKYDIDVFMDANDNFFNDLAWAKDFRKAALKYDDKPLFEIFAKPNDINKATVNILKEINAGIVHLGIESGSQRSLFRLGIKVEQKSIGEAIERLSANHVKMIFSFVLGAPGEDERTIDETLKLIKKGAAMPFVVDIHVSRLHPYPGSPAWKMLIGETGIKYKGKDIIEWREAMTDWIKLFCDISPKLFNEKVAEAKRLSRQTKIR